MPALTLTQAKQFLRYDADDASQDESLQISLRAGQEWVERNTGLLLTRREVVQPVARGVNNWPLLWGPVDGDVAVEYVDDDGETATIEGGRLRRLDSFGRMAISWRTAWPFAAANADVTYQAGYADADDIPGGLLEAMLVYAAMRDDQRAGGEGDAWRALWSIIAPYRAEGV